MSALVVLLESNYTIPNFAPDSVPSAFHYFLLLLGVPLILTAVIWGLGLGASRRKAFDDNDYLAGLRSGQDMPAITARRAAEQPVAVEAGGSHAARPSDVVRH